MRYLLTTLLLLATALQGVAKERDKYPLPSSTAANTVLNIARQNIWDQCGLRRTQFVLDQIWVASVGKKEALRIVVEQGLHDWCWGFYAERNHICKSDQTALSDAPQSEQTTIYYADYWRGTIYASLPRQCYSATCSQIEEMNCEQWDELYGDRVFEVHPND